MSRRGVAQVLCALVLLTAACSAPEEDADETPVLGWYVGPDRADTAALAQACTQASDGRYRIEVEHLPDDVGDRHSQLVRRLAAQDDTIDVLSLDAAFTSEFAAGELLAPLPDALAATYSEDVFPAALEAATVDGRLVAAPWWYDPYLLWYRGAAAERAGLDPAEPVLWDDLLLGAERVGATVHLDDPDGEGLAAWINALVVGAGGTLLAGAGREPDVGLDSEAGRVAAGVVEYYAEAGLGPGPTPDAVEAFAARGGDFLLAPSSVVSDPALSAVAGDLQWAPYPVVEQEAVAPLTGVALAVPLYAPEPALSYDAISCLTSQPSLEQLMLASGHSAARATTYDADPLAEGYPLAEVTRPAVEGGVGLPRTPYWQRVRAGLLDTWTPVTQVSRAGTPQESADAVTRLVGGGLQ